MRPAYYNEIEAFGCAWLRQAIAEGLIPAGHVDERDIRLVQPADLEGYGQVHFFAGIGGGAVACRLAGVPDDFPIITAGVPCQPASNAGKRLGESDDRWLWPEFLRLLGDRVLRSHYALAENPPGILTLADGAAFAGILGELAALGRDAEWSGVSAADVGASQERERVWLVAYPNRDAGERRSRADADRKGRLTTPPEPTYVRRAGELRADDAGQSCGTLADADRAGREEQQRAAVAVQSAHAPAQRSGEGVADADGDGYGGLTSRDSTHGRLGIEHGHDVDGCNDHRDGRVERPTACPARSSEDRPSQSPLGGAADGLPAYLGGAQWPAPPGEPQHEWEAPRLVAELEPNGRKALAAFGNAWVPQAALPALWTILEHAEASA